jgi:predicted secreted protein
MKNNMSERTTSTEDTKSTNAELQEKKTRKTSQIPQDKRENLPHKHTKGPAVTGWREDAIVKA